MKAGHIKGALLEYIVRQLLKSCGFSNVKSDGLYSFEKSGLYFINGKGAAHDADVIMNPPFQIPFGYPSQLIFECKAYTTTTVGLSIVRNALGFRNDVNDFEIVTHDFIKARKNNRRASLAVELRNRFIYQIGVASVIGYTKHAEEFAINNKIPLLSLNWFLDENTINNFNNINGELIESFNSEDIQNIYDFFKDRDGNLDAEKYKRAFRFLNEDNIIKEIVNAANRIIESAYVGLLETGDMIFLFNHSEFDAFSEFNHVQYSTEIHWYNHAPNNWELSFEYGNNKAKYQFNLPDNIMKHWQQFGLDKRVALDLKESFFSKMYIFNKNNLGFAPITTVKIDKRWLEKARRLLNNENE